MKRNLFFLLMATLLMTTAFATSGFAYPATGDDFTIVGQLDGGNAGRFVVEYGKGDSTQRYQTFCVENDEYITLGMTYTVQGLSTNLSPYTAYLYKEFLTGSYNDTSYFRPLQEAIWYFENGGSSIVSSGDEYSKYWYINQAIANNTSGSLFGVRVAVLDYDSVKVQDQLTMVPEPATVLLLGVGLIGIASIGRRKYIK